jgi:histidyl-tRNA synthetase
MDIVGCNTVAAEGDLIGAVIEMLKGFGLGSEDFSVRISSRKILSEFLDRLEVEASKKPAVYSALDKRSKIGEESFRKLLREQEIRDPLVDRLEAFFQCRSVHELAELFEEGQEPSGLTELRDLFTLLAHLGYEAFLSLDTSVVRGLAYYTGIVFEVFDKGQNLRAIAGGGRYDSLLSSLGGTSVSAVGFGMGDVVLADLLNGKGLLPTGRQGVDYYLADVAASELPRLELLRLAQVLRSRGRSAAYSLNGGKLKKQLTEANEQGARRLIFFGSDRALPGAYEVKDLATGEQKMMGEEEL